MEFIFFSQIFLLTFVLFGTKVVYVLRATRHYIGSDNKGDSRHYVLTFCQIEVRSGTSC